MPVGGYLFRVVAACAMFLVTHQFRLFAEEALAPQWLRGSGKDLQIRLSGEVFDTNGKEAADFQVSVQLNSTYSKPQLQAKVEGHRFHVWVPLNEPHWYSATLKATSKAGDQMAFRMVNAYEIRQAVIDGIKLTLESPTRQINVRVTDKGQPVAGAFVKAEVGFGVDLPFRTNSQGIARVSLLPKQELSGLMAWTDDFRIGGFVFDGKPVRDSNADEHTIELSPCRDQKLRFLSEERNPVSGIDVLIRVAIPPPNFNLIGTNEHSLMTTDLNGEVNYRWFPDWSEHRLYVDLKTNLWVPDGKHQLVDGVEVFPLKKSKLADRRRVMGKVTSSDPIVGGIHVALQSFQSERKNHRDIVSAFTDADGTFAVDVLPDASYCAWVLDQYLVSDIIDLIPYDSAADKISSPALVATPGQAVEVIVTKGPNKRPFSNLDVNFRRDHEYSWREDREVQHGVSGPQFRGTTDESGRVVVYTSAGKLKASIYSPTWRIEQSVEIRAGERTTILLHRDVEAKQTVTGRLILPEGLNADVSDAEIRMGSVDGNYDDQQTVKTTADSSFTFQTLSSQIGIFASTKDGLAAGSTIVTNLAKVVELPVHPTGEFQGKILGDGDRPLAGHRIQAIARVEGDDQYNSMFLKSFEAKRVVTHTNENGEYTLSGLPFHLTVYISADRLDDPKATTTLDEVYLEPNESRPVFVSRLGKSSSPPNQKTIADRYKAGLRDCALSKYHLMLILKDKDDLMTKFVDSNFKDIKVNPAIYSYLQLEVSVHNEGLSEIDTAFLKERNYSLPGKGHVFACAIDGQGRELGRIEIDVADTNAPEVAADFVRQHALDAIDAEQAWNHAFAEAKQTNRKVWVRISQRYCGPCFLLTRWLDDQRGLLEKDYVMLKIDDYHDLNGETIARRLTRGKSYGVPFSAIFADSDNMLIDSAGPLGNVGFPSGFDGKKQLRKMLMKSRKQLTDDEIDRLVESIGE